MMSDIKALLISFLIVFTYQITLNKPELPQVQAERIETAQKPVKKVSKPKPVKNTPKPKKAQTKPVQQPQTPVQPAPAPQPTGSIPNMITQASLKHGVDPARMLRVAQCESGLNPSIQNTGYYAGGGHPTGLFQYLPETWNRIAGRSPYGVGNIYSAQDQANVTAWAWANGYSGEWECQ